MPRGFRAFAAWLLAAALATPVALLAQPAPLNGVKSRKNIVTGMTMTGIISATTIATIVTTTTGTIARIVLIGGGWKSGTNLTAITIG